MHNLLAIIKATISRVLLLDILSDRSTWPAFAWAGLWILLGTLVYHEFEHWSWLDSLYFCVITLATVGYGDFTPTTPFTKIFTILYVLNGISILLFFLNTIMETRKTRGAERIARRRSSIET